MNKLFDQLTIFLLGCFGLFFLPLSELLVYTVFLAFLFFCLSFVLERKAALAVLTLIYSLLGIWLPPLYVFIALYFYGIFQWKTWYLLIPMGIGLFFAASTLSLQLFVFMGLSVLLAFYLWLKTSRYESSTSSLWQMRDDSTQLAQLLQRNNESLLLQQNQEIYTATLRERNRIAREIHDNVGHLLSRSIIMTGALQTINKDPAMAQPLSDLESSLNTAMNTIRSSVHDLHDESINLEEVVRELVADFQKCPISLEYAMSVYVPRDVKYCLISILKEGLTNIMKHSNATQVRITLKEHPGLYQLKVEDNGTNVSERPGSGMGLSNITHRVNLLHGVLNIQKQHGFHIFISIPKEIMKKEGNHEASDY